MKPYVIAINAVSGGGKTALATLLAASLPEAALFSFDDFDDTNVHPADYYDWAKRGGDISEFDCPGMFAAVEREIAQEKKRYVVLDYPFGRSHPRLSAVINLSVFIDTPLDIALARRVLRDYPISEASDLERLRKEMRHYLDKARGPYLAADRLKTTSDLILDGSGSLENMKDRILAELKMTGA